MIPYTALDTFTATNIYDLSDLVIGGANGVSNTPIKALLDRTQYLFNRLYRYDTSLPLAASASIDVSVIGKFISVSATSANVVLTLAALSSFPYGYVLPIAASCAVGKNVTIQAAPSQIIYMNGSYNDNMIYMHDGEVLYLLRDAGTWTVIAYKGNFERVGECVSGYVQMPGTLIRQGSTGVLNRADYPRLWKWINEKLLLGGVKVADATWLSDPNSTPVYRGCFSTGNGTTTFRLPDDRGLFDRYLDLNRGIDTNRLWNYPGGYEEMMLQAHNHKSGLYTNSADYTDGNASKNNIGNDPNPSNPAGTVTAIMTANTGGNSTHPKNNAKLPLIIF